MPITPRTRRRRLVLLLVGVAIAAAVVATYPRTAAPRSKEEAAYCGLVKSYQGLLNKAQPANGAADLGSQVAAEIALVDQATSSAPAEIKGDMEIFAKGYAQVASALADAKFHPEALGAEALQPLQSPEFESALGNIAKYDKRVCGIG